jgi:hypothetical protein
MQDPIPENIDGQKTVVHTVEHQIQWGYVAIGAAGILLLLIVYKRMESEDSEEEGSDFSL